MNVTEMSKDYFMIYRSLLRLAEAIFLFLPMTCFSQAIQIERTEIAGGKIIVHYSIIDTVAGKFYSVNAYSSQDNFMHPLAQVSGDAGINLRPGLEKKIVWDPAELGGNFDGKIALEIRARVYVPFIHFEGFQDYKHIKRLKPYAFTWSGGTAQNILNFDLYHKDEKIATFPNIANVGHYTLILPSNVRPGQHYRIRISDSKNKDEVVFTEEFGVRRKIPLALKAVPVLFIAGALYFLMGSDDKASPLPLPALPE
jgi:hypothetical protein